MFHVTVNNVPVPAVAIHNVTWVEAAPVEKLLGINYSLYAGDRLATPFENVEGKLIDGQIYVPWYETACGIRAERIDNSAGWNLCTVDGVIAATPVLTTNDMVLFWSGIGTPQLAGWQLDTGAFEPYVSQDTATTLNLPNLGPITVGGIGGSVNAYKSNIPSLTIGGHIFNDIPCVVDPAWSGPNLFGYRFFSDNNYNLYVDKHNFTLDIVK